MQLQRGFRIRLVAAIDAFAGAKLGDPDLASPLTDIDLRDTPYVIAGLINVLLDTVINFAFEPECLAVLDADLDGIEDLGRRLGVALSNRGGVARQPLSRAGTA